MPLILGTNSIKDTGYNVANSLRFEDGSNDFLNRTPSSSGNRKTWTLSTWIKRSELGRTQNFFSAGSGGDYARIQFNSNDKIYIAHVNGGSPTTELQTTARFRDTSAWMHILWHLNTTESTASNREKLYINGVEATLDTSTSDYGFPAEDYEDTINENVAHYIGNQVGAHEKCSLYLAETVFLDGTAATPTSLGEFDSDTPTVWKPVDPSGLTFGTNGFYLDYEDSSSLGNDTNGSNNFTVNNLTAIDQSTDTCTNNFCTWNPLANYTNGVAFSEGNLEATSGTNDQWDGGRASIGFSQGKWYFECLFVAGVSTQYIGVQDESAGFTGSSPHDQNGTTVFYNNSGGEIRKDGSATTNDYGTFTSSQVAGIGIDADNFTISVYKGGSAIVNAYALSTTRTGFLFPFTANLNNGDGVKVNFGSPPYSESGGNTDANGYGNFNQSVPSGYFAINSKNLAEYG